MARPSGFPNVLSAIVVNFRSSRLAEDCLRALLSGSRVPDELIVVDNEGIDGGLDDELAGDPRIRVVVRPDNAGYAAACNAGAALARGEQLLFLNADVTVEHDTLMRCLAALDDDPAIAVVTPRLVRLDGSLDHACHRGLPTPGAALAYKLRLDRLVPGWRPLGRYTMAWMDPTTDHDVEACSGAFLLIRRTDLDSVGGWDERYRFYAEDLDLCVRVGTAGRRIRYLGSVQATHLKGAFSHYGIADGELDASQQAVKRWVERQVLASHRLFFDEHIAPGSMLPTRLAIGMLFRLQAARIDLVDRRAPA